MPFRSLPPIIDMKYTTPFKLFLSLTLVIGITEYAIMSLLNRFTFSPLAAGLLDSIFLTLILFPFLYLLVYRPVRRNVLQLRQTNEKLEFGHNRLLSILNGIEATVYVADMQTYDVLLSTTT